MCRTCGGDHRTTRCELGMAPRLVGNDWVEVTLQSISYWGHLDQESPYNLGGEHMQTMHRKVGRRPKALYNEAPVS